MTRPVWDAATPSAPPAEWLEHLADEADAAWLYLELAALEPDPTRADVFRGLADVEERHVGAWMRLLAEQGFEVARPAPSRQARIRAWVARRIGARAVLPMMLEEEGREVRGYLEM